MYYILWIILAGRPNLCTALNNFLGAGIVRNLGCLLAAPPCRSPIILRSLFCVRNIEQAFGRRLLPSSSCHSIRILTIRRLNVRLLPFSL